MEHSKPLIGIVGKVIDPHFFGWTSVDISNDIRRALIKNGARVIGILPPQPDIIPSTYEETSREELTAQEAADFESVLQMCSGIVLEGGLTAYKYEEHAARYALEKDIPLLAICAGLNNLVRSQDGEVGFTPVKDSHNRPDVKYLHDVLIDPDSMFYQIVKKERITVNSIHGRTPKEVKGYRIVGKSDDGLTEVIEMTEKRFHIGVTFHPERLVDEDETMNGIFRAFITAAAGK